MKILDILNSSWAIDQQVLKDMQDYYINHMRKEKIDFAAFASNEEKTEPYPYLVKKNVAIISIGGVMTPAASIFSYIFGGTSYKFIAKALNQAIQDQQIKTIILDIDSPGGTVKGAFETSDMIRKSPKPIYTWSGGQITSAAVLIAAPTKKIMITGKTNVVGSIGVIATHIDYSESDKKYGVKVSEIVSGKYKNIYSDSQPLSKEGKDYIQEEVDYLFSLFANDVSKDRGIDLQTIVDWQAKTFIGQQAIEADLVDGVSTLDDLINELSNGKTDLFSVSGDLPGVEKTMEKNVMSDLTVMSLEKDHPEIYQAIFNAGKDLGIKDGEKKGIEAERERINAINAAVIPGHDELVKKCIDDGLSAGETAVKILAAEKNHLKAQAEVIQKEAPKPVNVDVPPVEPKEETKVDKKNLPLDLKAKAEWDESPDLRSEFIDDFGNYLAFCKAKQDGQARIYKQ